jgi:hypothetical protein
MPISAAICTVTSRASSGNWVEYNALSYFKNLRHDEVNKRQVY